MNELLSATCVATDMKLFVSGLTRYFILDFVAVPLGVRSKFYLEVAGR